VAGQRRAVTFFPAVENPAGADETLVKVLAVADGDPHLQDLGPGSPSGAFV
jgi:hypothetical protein